MDQNRMGSSPAPRPRRWKPPTEIRQAPDEPRSRLWSVISLVLGGWIAISCAGALIDLIRDGAFEFPKYLVKGPTGLNPWFFHYATEPGLTVAFAVVTAIAGLLGICATVFGITDLWKKSSRDDCRE